MSVPSTSELASPTTLAVAWRVLRAVPGARRRDFARLCALMIAGAVAELVSIGAVLPFLSVLADPSSADRMGIVARAFEAVGADRLDERTLAAAALFAAAAIVAGVVRIWLLWDMQGFMYRFAHLLSVEVHRRMLYQEYGYHVSQNTSQFLAALEKVQTLLFNLLVPGIQAVASAVIAAFMIAALVWVDPFTAVIAAGAFAALYLLVSVLSRKRLRAYSIAINAASPARLQAVRESLGGIRDVILDRAQAFHLAAFSGVDARFRQAQARAAFMGGAPRFVIEAAGLVLIAFLAVVIATRTGGLISALPVLGVLALGAQRLLPLMQQVYYGWSSLAAGRHMLLDVSYYLALPIPPGGGAGAVEPLPFERAIVFESVGFRYAERSAAVLSGIDLKIPAGSRLAIIGKTGSGKSTLMDLLMGLIEPTEGSILVDGTPLTGPAREAWQRQLAHVPQSIFLSDASIERNIAFGTPADAIDHDRVVAAARKAQLADFIETLPQGYETRVGERGVQLSGGQRQRLGLARALYKDAKVLVLDEATSALDDATEAAVIATLDKLGRELTVIMIAHRLSTVATCDQVVRLEAGRVVDSGSYQQVAQQLANTEPSV